MGDAPGVPSRWFGGILWREFGIGLCMSYIRLLLFAIKNKELWGITV